MSEPTTQSDKIVFPDSAGQPRALQEIDKYERNGTAAMQKLQQAISQAENQLNTLRTSLITVRAQLDLVADLKQKLLAGEDAPAAPAATSETPQATS